MTTTKNAARSPKAVRIENVSDRDFTRFGVTHPGRVDSGHHAEITVGQSIRLHGTLQRRDYVKGEDGLYSMVTRTENYDRTFRIGDTAEYDSYNMHYCGPIVAIGEKTVTIQEEGSRGLKGKTRRLSIYDLCARCCRRTLHQHCGICMRCGFDPTWCRQCKAPVPRARWVYWVPTCYECVPPPPPIETLPE